MNDLLLESLSSRFGCFISDLKSRTICLRALRELQSRPVQQYPLADWEECLSYLLDCDVKLSGYEELEGLLEKAAAQFSIFSTPSPTV